MSSKLNVTEIIRGHFLTLKCTSGKLSKVDLAVFVGLPITIAFLFAAYGYDLDSELRSLLVNFGAIFTALLLSVLVLVYDQEKKYSEAPDTDILSRSKKTLLRELYYNISFSIVCAVALVIVSLLHAVAGRFAIEVTVFSYHIVNSFGSLIFTPLVTYITITIFLNVIMVVKRMHTLLTT